MPLHFRAIYPYTNIYIYIYIRIRLRVLIKFRNYNYSTYLKYLRRSIDRTDRAVSILLDSYVTYTLANLYIFFAVVYIPSATLYIVLLSSSLVILVIEVEALLNIATIALATMLTLVGLFNSRYIY